VISISSVVAHVEPQRLAAVREAFRAMDGVEVSAISPEGRLVATIEVAAEERAVAAIERMRSTEGVLSVAMVFHQVEQEPDKEL
jgi:nitrate reductase NapD